MRRAYKHRAKKWATILRGDPCPYCAGKRGQARTVDHIHPLSVVTRERDLFPFGPNSWENLTGACFGCNQDKEDKNLLIFLVATQARETRLALSRKHGVKLIMLEKFEGVDKHGIPLYRKPISA